MLSLFTFHYSLLHLLDCYSILTIKYSVPFVIVLFKILTDLHLDYNLELFFIYFMHFLL